MALHAARGKLIAVIGDEVKKLINSLIDLIKDILGYLCRVPFGRSWRN